MTTFNDGSIPIWDAKTGKLLQVVAGDHRTSVVGGVLEKYHNDRLIDTKSNPSLIVTERDVIVWSGKGIILYKWSEDCLEKVCQKSFVECGLDNVGFPLRVVEVRIVHNILVIYYNCLLFADKLK